MAQSFSRSSYAVLIVEDEPLLMAEAVDIVEDAGFIAYEARSSDQAIHMLERHSEIRVLFTDIDMPGSMDGLKLAHAVRNRWPPVAIMVTSGHVIVSEDELPKGGQFFSKPYPSAVIMKALGTVAARLKNVTSS